MPVRRAALLLVQRSPLVGALCFWAHALVIHSLTREVITMKHQYEAPSLESLGAMSVMTAAFGTDPSPDVSEFPQIPAATGSFDVCEELVCNDD